MSCLILWTYNQISQFLILEHVCLQKTVYVKPMLDLKCLNKPVTPKKLEMEILQSTLGAVYQLYFLIC